MKRLSAKSQEPHFPIVNGQSLFWDLERRSAEMAAVVAGVVEQTPLVLQTHEVFDPAKVRLYLEKMIREEIRPLTHRFMRSEWARWDHHHGLGEVVRRHALPPGTSLELGPELGFDRRLDLLFQKTRRALKRRLHRRREGPSLRLEGEGPRIAVAYREGLDFEKRCDLYWFPSSGIDPSKIVIFFDGRYPSYLSPVPETVLKKIEDWGMSWVCLEGGSVERSNPFIWRQDKTRPPIQEGLLCRCRQDGRSRGLKGWVGRTIAELLDEVATWYAFYHDLNIRIHFEVEEGNSRNLAQCLAMDLIGGVLVGKQRSQLFYPLGSRLGFDQKHLFFGWGPSVLTHLIEGKNEIDATIISGYPNDAAFSKLSSLSNEIRQGLSQRGARFLVALFDNMFGSDTQYSKEMILNLYRHFVNWVFEDPEIGLIIKSKKPTILENLPEIQQDLDRVQATGRCHRLPFVAGQLPAIGSLGADMTVGVGISSAVLEGAIAGRRGVHWDPTGMRHEIFLPWGDGKVLFRDLDQLMDTLKRYKKDPRREPMIGDFSPILDQIDPFRDGRGGERVGGYLSSLLERLSRGMTIHQAVRETNQGYRARWGRDKVIAPEVSDVEPIRRVAT